MPSDYFYIKSISTGNVVSAITHGDPLRSQVLVTPPTLSDAELWYWKGQFICNKANGLVLDIRKGKLGDDSVLIKANCRLSIGRLRLIEDTEICLYHAKPLDEAHNQLWGVRNDAADAYGKPLVGSYIYSIVSNEWVLDIQAAENGTQKLVLFPLQPIDNDNQRWLFVPEGELSIQDTKTSYFPTHIMTPPDSITSSPTYSTSSPDISEFPQGLTPAKRGSHSVIFSMEAFKDYHNRVYGTQEGNIR